MRPFAMLGTIPFWMRSPSGKGGLCSTPSTKHLAMHVFMWMYFQNVMPSRSTAFWSYVICCEVRRSFSLSFMTSNHSICGTPTPDRFPKALRNIEAVGDSSMILKTGRRLLRRLLTSRVFEWTRFLDSLREVLGKVDAMGENVGVLGLYGMGGVGKTTLADEVYGHLLSRGGFKPSFLKDVRSNLLLELQRQLVRDLIQDEYAGGGSYTYQHKFNRFGTQKVLIVVDDIDNISQFADLIPNILQLHRGSRIVVTSRHLDVLKHSMGSTTHKALHEVTVLNTNYSRQIFNWHAFCSEVPSNEFRDLAQRVADACGGHPLALEIIGASLFDKKDLEVNGKVWLDAINSMKGNRDILDKLRISYDNLPVDGDKAMFRDIACLMIGMREELALDIWELCKSCSNYCCSTTKVPHLALSRLVNKSLVRVRNGKLRMHDLIRDMGRDIVMKKKRPTHVWDNAMVEKLLSKHQGRPHKVRGITLPYEGTEIAAPPLAIMVELHLLVLIERVVEGYDISSWSRELRWLRWRVVDFCTELPS